MRLENRESTIKGKLRKMKHLSFLLEDMTAQVLSNTWKDRVKSTALDVITEYAEFLLL